MSMIKITLANNVLLCIAYFLHVGSIISLLIVRIIDYGRYFCKYIISPGDYFGQTPPDTSSNCFLTAPLIQIKVTTAKQKRTKEP